MKHNVCLDRGSSVIMNCIFGSFLALWILLYSNDVAVSIGTQILWHSELRSVAKHFFLIFLLCCIMLTYLLSTRSIGFCCMLLFKEYPQGLPFSWCIKNEMKCTKSCMLWNIVAARQWLLLALHDVGVFAYLLVIKKRLHDLSHRGRLPLGDLTTERSG